MVEDPSFTAITARAAADLAGIADRAGQDGSEPRRLASAARAGLDALWDDELGWFRPYDVRTAPGRPGHLHRPGRPLRRRRRGPRGAVWLARLDAWSRALSAAIATTDPEDPSFDPIRYWRGPVWVLVNWLVADGLSRTGRPRDAQRAEALRLTTRALVEQGFSEYYDPRNRAGIGGQGFSWSAALTLAWLTA